MAHDNHQNPDQTGYEYFNEAIVVWTRAYALTRTYCIKESKPDPIWLKGRKNKRDNFKLK